MPALRRRRTAQFSQKGFPVLSNRFPVHRCRELGRSSGLDMDLKLSVSNFSKPSCSNSLLISLKQGIPECRESSAQDCDHRHPRPPQGGRFFWWRRGGEAPSQGAQGRRSRRSGEWGGGPSAARRPSGGQRLRRRQTHFPLPLGLAQPRQRLDQVQRLRLGASGDQA